MTDFSLDREGDFASRWRQVRACARCRRLKMKCLYEDPSYKSCKRCYAANLVCSVDQDPTAQFARKKRRRALNGLESKKEVEMKVENLKKTVDSLESMLKEVSRVEDGDAILEPIYKKIDSLSSRINSAEDSKLKEDTNVLEEDKEIFPAIEYGKNLMIEIVHNKRMISKHECEERFKFFQSSMLQYYPVLQLSEKLRDFEYMFENSPLLLATCISVTAMNDNKITFDKLDNEPKPSNEYTFRFFTYYLERFLSYKICIKSDDFDYQLIYSCLILSLWSLPSPKLCHYQSHLFLLMGLDISFCINLGENINLDDIRMKRLIADDNSVERNRLRAFLSVYACCGSLELSLPRFKLVTWGKKHDMAYKALTSIKKHHVSVEDRYICCFASIIRIGQEIFEFLSQNNLINTPSSSINRSDGTRRKDASYSNGKQNGIFSLQNIQFVLYNYEQKLNEVLSENDFTKDFGTKDNVETDSIQKESILLSAVYYQLLIVIYDNLVSSFLFTYSSNAQSVQDSGSLNDTKLLQQVIKLINACDGVLKSFITLNLSYSINPPTFFYYKAMHALILLIRIRLVVLSKKFPSLNMLSSSGDINANLESNFEKVKQILHSKRLNPLISSRMLMILSNISKWITISNNYKSHLANKEKVDPSENFVHLMSMTKDQEIENLKVPKDLEPKIPKNNTTSTASQLNFNATRNIGMNNAGKSSELNEEARDKNPLDLVTGLPSFFQESNDITIEDIFKEIDANIFNYLNPIESAVDDLQLMGYNPTMDLNNDKYSTNVTTDDNSYF